MFIDSRLEFSNDQAETTAATYNSDNVVNSSVARDLGAGQPVYLVVVCTETPTSGGSATVAFQLVSDGDPTPATNGNQTIHLATGAKAFDSMAAGDVVWQTALPLEGVAYEQYLAVQYVIATAALTAGKFSAFLTLTPHKLHSYPNAI